MSSTSESQKPTPPKRRCRPRSGLAKRYPTDLTDAQWALIEPLLPPPATGGRPEKHPRREIVNAILYLDRAGCAWRLLPRCFPPWETVYWHWARWKNDATKRHIVTDTLGLLLVVLVTAASVQDRDGGRRVLDRLRFAVPSVALVFADGGYAGRLVEWARRVLRVVLEIVRKPEGQTVAHPGSVTRCPRPSPRRRSSERGLSRGRDRFRCWRSWPIGVVRRRSRAPGHRAWRVRRQRG